MDALTGIKDDVRFNYEAAGSSRASSGRARSSCATRPGGRSRLASDALKRWDGRYADMFEQRQTQAAQQASGLARALDQAARDVEALKQAAQEEQDRREQAREWQEEHKEDIEDWYDGLQFWEDDLPAGSSDRPRTRRSPTRRRSRPSASRSTARAGRWTSARPRRRTWTPREGARAADDDLERHQRKLPGLHKDFVDGCGWGHFDADLADQRLRPVHRPQRDRRALGRPDRRGRSARAGGDGDLSRLPDAAIEASLQAAGLAGGARSVTFDSPRRPTASRPPAATPTTRSTPRAATSCSPRPTCPSAGCAGLTFRRIYNSRSDRAGAFGPRLVVAGPTPGCTPRDDGAEYDGPDGQRALFPRQGAGYGRVARHRRRWSAGRRRARAALVRRAALGVRPGRAAGRR